MFVFCNRGSTFGVHLATVPSFFPTTFHLHCKKAVTGNRLSPFLGFSDLFLAFTGIGGGLFLSILSPLLTYHFPITGV